MKVTIQWKDPDFCNARTGEYPSDNPDDGIDDLVFSQLQALGMAEYVQIEFDTDAMTAKVVNPRKK